MIKTLYVGYMGKSSGLILDKLSDDDNDKAYLKGEKVNDHNLVGNLLQDKSYERAIIFGQKPLINNKICVEKVAVCRGGLLPSNFDLDSLYKVFDENLINYKKSTSPGSSLSNKMYEFVLSTIYLENLNTTAVLIQVPYLESFPSIDKFVEIISKI